MTNDVGLIGLGAMGKGMAQSLPDSAVIKIFPGIELPRKG